MWVSPGIAVVTAIYLILARPDALLIALPILSLWIASPLFTWWISRPIARYASHPDERSNDVSSQDGPQDLVIF